MKESDRSAEPLPEHSRGSPENVSRGAAFTPHPTRYQVHVDVGPDGRFRQWVLLAPVPGVLVEVPTLDGPELSDDEVRAIARGVAAAIRPDPRALTAESICDGRCMVFTSGGAFVHPGCSGCAP